MKKIKYYFALLAGITLWGCGDKDKGPGPDECGIAEQRIPSGDNARLFVPNAFSPNGDGLNDRFGPFVHDIASIRFTVFDSKGVIVFTTDLLNQYWTAPATSEMEIYRYKVAATTLSGNPVAFCGTVYAMSCVPFYLSRADLIFGDQYDPNMPGGYINGASHEVLPDCN